MAEVNTDDELTSGQSNQDDAGKPAATVTDNQDDDQGAAQGQAGANQDDDQGGSDEGGDADATGAEGSQQTRGERRHERYIDKLAAEIRQGNDQSSRYTDEIFSPKPYSPIEYKPDQEYDPKQLEEDRSTVAQNARAEGIQTGLHQGSSQVQKELWTDRFDIDSERVTQRWDILNPDKQDTYSPKLEASLVQGYVAFVGMERDAQGRISIQRPNVRFKDYVEAQLNNMEEYASLRNAKSSTNLARQAAHTGVRPNGQSRVSKGDHGFDPNDPVGSVNRMSSKQYFDLGGKEASDAYLKSRGIG